MARSTKRTYALTFSPLIKLSAMAFLVNPLRSLAAFQGVAEAAAHCSNYLRETATIDAAGVRIGYHVVSGSNEKRGVVNNLNQQQQRAVRWLSSEAGAGFLAAEQELFNQRLQRCFGLHLLQCSIVDGLDLYNNSPVNHCFKFAPRATELTERAAVAEFNELPLEDNSVDVVLLHHVMEFSADPHALLREIARVVRPEGRILVMVFNPWSMLHLRQVLTHRFDNNAWHCQKIGGHRVADWLRLLNFNINQTDFCLYGPRLRGSRLAKPGRPLHFLLRPLGGAALVTATKRSTTLIPLRKRWHELSPGLAVPMGKPSPRAAMEKHKKP